MRRYTVIDATGNNAQALTRRVTITCPTGEVLCSGSADGGSRPHCSCSGICGLDSPTCVAIQPAPLTNLPPPLSLGGYTVEAEGGYSIELNLLGPSLVTLPRGSRPYHKCSGLVQQGCDAGVIATRVQFGDYSQKVVACEERARSVLGVEVRPQEQCAGCCMDRSWHG